jgi:hypothetical protein
MFDLTGLPFFVWTVVFVFMIFDGTITVFAMPSVSWKRPSSFTRAKSGLRR